MQSTQSNARREMSAQLQVQQKAIHARQRHPLAEIQREAYSLGAVVQAGVERLIDQTAPRLAAERDPGERAALLAHACAALGQAITTEFARSTRRLRAQGKAA